MLSTHTQGHIGQPGSRGSSGTPGLPVSTFLFFLSTLLYVILPTNHSLHPPLQSYVCRMFDNGIWFLSFLIMFLNECLALPQVQFGIETWSICFKSIFLSVVSLLDSINIHSSVPSMILRPPYSLLSSSPPPQGLFGLKVRASSVFKRLIVPAAETNQY